MSELLGTIDETKEPLSLVQCLKAFNRKERYWLIQNALGDPKQPLDLSSDFRDRLEALLDLPIPQNAWWGIDYHIDWLFAAIAADRDLMPEETSPRENPTAGQFLDGLSQRAIRGTQEDFDFIIAFGRTIILIEAKAGRIWSNSQLASKCQRLRELPLLLRTTEDALANDPALPKIYVVLMSPVKSETMQPPRWPPFINAGRKNSFHITLGMQGAPASFIAPERCTAKGDPDKMGEWWQLKDVPRSRLEEN